MVGWFDAVEKGDALRYGGFQDMVINKLDALGYGSDWKNGPLLICTHYQDTDGNDLYHVPRAYEKHRQLKPVYREVEAWEEDISGIREFEKLPANAKCYVANLMQSTLQVAFGRDLNKWPEDLPNLRYIGVGPDPDQIISDIPTTTELLKLV